MSDALDKVMAAMERNMLLSERLKTLQQKARTAGLNVDVDENGYGNLYIDKITIDLGPHPKCGFTPEGMTAFEEHVDKIIKRKQQVDAFIKGKTQSTGKESKQESGL